MQCTISKGDSPVEINWFLNGIPIREIPGISSNQIGKRINSLSIESIDAHHTGTYTCKATNVAGSTNYTAYLAVNGTYQFSLDIFNLQLLLK